MTAAAPWRFCTIARPATPGVPQSINQGELSENHQDISRRLGGRHRGHDRSPPYAADKGLVGVLMPTKTSQRWINDGDAVKSQLEAKGYTVDLQYAQDDIPNQLAPARER